MDDTDRTGDTGDTGDLDDTGLEAVFRVGLRRRAEDAVVQPDLVDRVTPRRRHRRLGVVAVVAAAAAVVVVAVGVDAVRDPHGPQSAVSDRGVSHSATGATPGWRTESWHGLQVSVPADWGWGTAPVVEGGQEYLCGAPGAVIAADGSRSGGGGAWVGRPIMLSDACQGGDVLANPTAPYVWLGADIRPGMVELGNGYTQQTVDVQGTTLTVGTDDAALRQRLLDSATPEATCPSHVGAAPTIPFTRSGTTEVPLPDPKDAVNLANGQICAYLDTGHGYDLVFATRFTPAQAKVYTAAVYDGGFEKSRRFCDSGTLLIVVGVRVQVAENNVVNLACQQVQDAPGQVTPLSDHAFAVLAGTGVGAVQASGATPRSR